MIGKKILLTAYDYSYDLVERATEGLTHQSSIIKPPGSDNPANWILGHILASRCNVQALLGLTPTWDLQRCKPYLPDSAPLDPQGQVENLSAITAGLESTQEDLLRILEDLKEEDLMERKGENSLGENLAGYAIHEAFHAGELAMIRTWLI